MSKVKIKGIMPPAITPFKENGEVDYESFIYNIERWNNDNLSGYVILGSNSETIFLNEEEKLTLISEAVRTAKTDRTIIVGTGMESTRETISLTNKAAKLGAQMALILTPFYYGMSSEALITYFTDVADNCDIPILLYNVPKYTHVNLKADVVAELSKHPNIVGMKDSTGDVPQLATYKRVVSEDFNLMVGTAAALFPALTLGVDAAILALANCNPNECDQVVKAFEAGEYEKARDIYQTLFPINTAVTGTYGIAGLKYACDLMGYKGGHVRKPLLDLGKQDKEALKTLMDKQLNKILV